MNQSINIERLAEENIDGIRAEGLRNQALRRAGVFGDDSPSSFKQLLESISKPGISKIFRQESRSKDIGFPSESPGS